MPNAAKFLCFLCANFFFFVCQIFMRSSWSIHIITFLFAFFLPTTINHDGKLRMEIFLHSFTPCFYHHGIIFPIAFGFPATFYDCERSKPGAAKASSRSARESSSTCIYENRRILMVSSERSRSDQSESTLFQF